MKAASPCLPVPWHHQSPMMRETCEERSWGRLPSGKQTGSVTFWNVPENKMRWKSPHGLFLTLSQAYEIKCLCVLGAGTGPGVKQEWRKPLPYLPSVCLNFPCLSCLGLASPPFTTSRGPRWAGSELRRHLSPASRGSNAPGPDCGGLRAWHGSQEAGRRAGGGEGMNSSFPALSRL